MSASFSIQDRQVGPGSPALIVAEVAQAHDGSLGTAHAYIDAVAETGADAVKFQTHIAAAESSPAEQFRVKFSSQDATRYDYWKRMEFTASAWRELADHARQRGLIFLSTPFSFEALDLLAEIGMPAWKVGSGEVTNLPLIEDMAETGMPVLISSGLSTWEDLDQAVACVRPRAPLAVFQCTTAYPCPAEKVGLNVLAELRDRYSCSVGLSDHSGEIYASLAAVALGANLIEAHVVFSRECFGPDTPASLTTAQFKSLVEGARFIERALANPLDKSAEAAQTHELKIMFGKSLVASHDLPSGHLLQSVDIALKKPGAGIPAARLGDVLGWRIKRAVAAGSFLSEADLD